MTDSPMDRVLLVTQDALLAAAYRARLQRAGFEVDTAPNASAALAEAREHLPACLVVDVHLPGLDGLEFLKWLTDVPWLVTVPVVLLVERTLTTAVQQECAFWGAKRLSYKDADPPEDLPATIRAILAAQPASA